MGIDMVRCSCGDGKHAPISIAPVRLFQKDLPTEKSITGSPPFHEYELPWIFFSDPAKALRDRIECLVPADLHPARILIETFLGIRAFQRRFDPMRAIIARNGRKPSPHAELTTIGGTIRISLGFQNNAILDSDEHATIVLETHGTPTLEPSISRVLVLFVVFHIFLSRKL
jgi:hypothetical protein